jgi:adenylyltransferase/sulfurtransferase
MNTKDIFSRQTLCNRIGPGGQEKLELARVVLVGAGGLGSWAAELLARCGVGHIRLIDDDVVEYSNLARQAMYTRNDAEKQTPKVTAAAKRLAEINPDCFVEPVRYRLGETNANTLLSAFNVVLDATDDWKTRFIINSWCVENNVPWVFGGVVATVGQVLPIIPHRTACLACIFHSPPKAADELASKASVQGVIGPAVAAIASLQAAMTVRLITGDHTDLPCLTSIDCWDLSSQKLNTEQPNPLCHVCGRRGDMNEREK